MININKTTKKKKETDPALLSQAFNFFFNNCTKIESKLVDSSKNYADYLKEPQKLPRNLEEIEGIIKILNIHKSIGPNSIPTKPLK